MSRSTQTVEMTVRLSKDRYEQIRQAAHMEHRPVEDILDGLIVEGLESQSKHEGDAGTPFTGLPCSLGPGGKAVTVCRDRETRTRHLTGTDCQRPLFGMS